MAVFDRDAHLAMVEGFGLRAQQARALRDLVLARAGGPRASVTALAEEVGALLGEPVSGGDVGRWLAGFAVPSSLARISAFAYVLGVDAGWLTFGDLTAAPGPSLLSVLPSEPMELLPQEKPRRRRRNA